MFAQSPLINYAARPSESFKSPVGGTGHILAQAILASWFDGVLLLTEQGKWIQANEAARRICDRLSPGSPSLGQTPDAIWQVCQTLIQSRRQQPNSPMIVESELKINKSAFFRIRVQWLRAGDKSHSYVLVILEDRGQAVQSQAITEAEHFGLTPRESKVWALYRSHYTYREIALELHISVHTVKKHLKNIRTKQHLAQAM